MLIFIIHGGRMRPFRPFEFTYFLLLVCKLEIGKSRKRFEISINRESEVEKFRNRDIAKSRNQESKNAKREKKFSISRFLLSRYPIS